VLAICFCSRFRSPQNAALVTGLNLLEFFITVIINSINPTREFCCFVTSGSKTKKRSMRAVSQLAPVEVKQRTRATGFVSDLYNGQV
jgi:hypothetical protein